MGLYTNGVDGGWRERHGGDGLSQEVVGLPVTVAFQGTRDNRVHILIQADSRPIYMKLHLMCDIGVPQCSKVM